MTDLLIGPIIAMEAPWDGISAKVDPHREGTLPTMELLQLPYYVPPFTRFLAYTADVITAPRGLLSVVTMRSTWARLGLLCPPTVVDPGFIGNITLEVLNTSSYPILIRPTDKIFSLVWMPLIDIKTVYEGRYQGQTGLQLPRPLGN
ncbi:MAG: hypothetical protein HY459_02855 [Parcubacteria group bacterium]|nr:hypothetical protein [Parcubacteria group bacterium]